MRAFALTVKGETMAEILLRALARAGRSINNPFAMGGAYVLPKQGDAQKDFGRISGDMRRVGEDLKKTAEKALKQHGK
jgi:hypothetical protein